MLCFICLFPVERLVNESFSHKVSKGKQLLLTQRRPNRVGQGTRRFGRGALRLSLAKPRVVERPKVLVGRASFSSSRLLWPTTSWPYRSAFCAPDTLLTVVSRVPQHRPPILRDFSPKSFFRCSYLI